MLKNLRRKAPEKDKLGHDLFKLAKVNICFILFYTFLSYSRCYAFLPCSLVKLNSFQPSFF